jgi:hypothetical protein
MALLLIILQWVLLPGNACLEDALIKERAEEKSEMLFWQSKLK